MVPKVLVLVLGAVALLAPSSAQAAVRPARAAAEAPAASVSTSQNLTLSPITAAGCQDLAKRGLADLIAKFCSRQADGTYVATDGPALGTPETCTVTSEVSDSPVVIFGIDTQFRDSIIYTALYDCSAPHLFACSASMFGAIIPPDTLGIDTGNQGCIASTFPPAASLHGALIVLTGAIVDLENGDYAIDGPIVDTVP